LDDFKQVNDRLGHPAGDQALRAIAEVLARKLRTEDIAARVGGEEFGILAPQTDRDGAQILGEQLRQLAEDNEWSRGVGQMALTVSIGTATFPNDADAACDLIQKADVALYRAKRSGRNRVVSYAPNCDETEK
jgi:diguanylate cyclase (GGDEF)-like protein